MSDEKLIKTPANKPYRTTQAAVLAAGRLKIQKDKYEIVPFQDGFAIKTKEEDIGKREEKFTTKPWDANENPWSMDKLKIKRRPGFRPKFVSADKIQVRLQEGWQFADQKNYPDSISDRITEDTVDSKIRRGSMVLMEIPEEMAKKREEHFAFITKQRSKDARDIAFSQAKKLGITLDDLASSGEVSTELLNQYKQFLEFQKGIGKVANL